VKTPASMLRRAAVAFALGLLSSAPATAHNGAVAHAPVLSGIVVDGDLSDWPQQRNSTAGTGYFLDTDICIYFLRGEFPSIKTRLNQKKPRDAHCSYSDSR
jgi:hypothetical protein